MPKRNTQYAPDVAIAYRGTYSNSKGSGTYLKVILKEDLEAGTEIIAFPTKKEKRNETDPDFGFRVSEKKSTGGRAAAPRATSTKKVADDLEDDAVDF